MDFKWMAVLDGKHRHIYSDKKQVKRQRGGFRRPSAWNLGLTANSGRR